MTHHATSKSGERMFQKIMGCQMFQGRPRSKSSPTATAPYPRKAVRMAGRAAAWYFSPWKMWTTAAMTKPPAASATPPITSKPIHSPQGVVSERAVDTPSPSVNRRTATAAARPATHQRIPLKTNARLFPMVVPLARSRALARGLEASRRRLSITQ